MFRVSYLGNLRTGLKGEKSRHSKNVFRGGPRPDAVLGTPQRSRRRGRPKPHCWGVDVSAADDDDDDERERGDGWWEFRDDGGDHDSKSESTPPSFHVAIQRTRHQPSARVEQERFGFTDHGAVAEETVQVGR